MLRPPSPIGTPQVSDLQHAESTPTGSSQSPYNLRHARMLRPNLALSSWNPLFLLLDVYGVPFPASSFQSTSVSGSVEATK